MYQTIYFQMRRTAKTLALAIFVLLPYQSIAEQDNTITALEQLDAVMTRLKQMETSDSSTLLKQGQVIIAQELQMHQGTTPLQLEAKQVRAKLAELQRQDKALAQRVRHYRPTANNRFVGKRLNRDIAALKKALRETIDFANNDLNVRIHQHNAQMDAQRVAFVKNAEQVLTTNATKEQEHNSEQMLVGSPE